MQREAYPALTGWGLLLTQPAAAAFRQANLHLASGAALLLSLLLETTASGRARKQAGREKDEFLSMASHERKTPLTTINLAAQMLRRATRKDALEPALLARQATTGDQVHAQPAPASAG